MQRQVGQQLLSALVFKRIFPERMVENRHKHVAEIGKYAINSFRHTMYLLDRRT